MRKIFASFYKEWILLWRDKVGLIFLFLLPMCLVLFITLSHSEQTGKSRELKLLLLNEEPKATLTKDVVKELKKNKDISVIDITKSNDYTELSAKEAVANGQYEGLIILPEDMSKTVEDRLKIENRGEKISTIVIYFDPGMPAMLQKQIELAMKLFASKIEAKVLLKTYQKATRQTEKNFDIITSEIKYVDTNPNYHHQSGSDDVQRNVPAWTLFGMFFIITPISGILVKERTLGVMNRLRIAPVAFSSLLTGKIIAFILLNLIQLVLMLCVGIFLLPLFGLSSLNINDHIGLIALIGLCAAFAATGFGLFIGSLVRTAEQANVVGPFIIVIASAVGGILIPTYLLPEGLQKASLYSPLNWAHTAFTDVFLRDATLHQISPNLYKLIIFAFISVILAVLKLRRRAH